MRNLFDYILFYFESIATFFSFLFSLRLINNKNIPSYMRGFYLYPTVGFLGIIFLISILLFFPNYSKYAAVESNYSLIFHYCFLSYFIIKVLPNKKYNWYLFIIFFIFLSVILYLLFTRNVYRQISFAFAVSNLGLIIFCIIYYVRLFNNIPTIDLKREPSFWIITGIFFCMSAQIPSTGFYDFIQKDINISTARILYSISLFCYAIMHLFFIKAILCAVQPRKI